MSLKQLKFSDIYLGADSTLISGVPNTLDPVPVPEEAKEDASLLRAACLEFQLQTPDRSRQSLDGCPHVPFKCRCLRDQQLPLRVEILSFEER